MSEKEEFEDMFKDYAEPMPDFEMVVEAANALYMAGRWSIDNTQFGAPCEEHQIALWEDLRAALGLAPGHSTEAGVNPFVDASVGIFPPGIVWYSGLKPIDPDGPQVLSQVILLSFDLDVPIVECVEPKEPTDIEKLCHRLDVMISHLEDIAENTESL